MPQNVRKPPEQILGLLAVILVNTVARSRASFANRLFLQLYKLYDDITDLEVLADDDGGRDEQESPGEADHRHTRLVGWQTQRTTLRFCGSL